MSARLDVPAFDYFVDDLGRDGQVAAVLGVGALLAAFVSFLLAPGLMVYPVVVFAVVAVYGWATYQAETAKSLTFLTTISTVVILGLITAYLFVKAIPVANSMGIQLLTGTVWDTGRGAYGLLPMMWGTFVTTLIATLIAGPLGVAGAIFIAEIAPPAVRETTKPAIELLAGIPSIVYGFIGYIVINSYMMDVFRLPTLGSLFIVGIVIGVMALPTVVSVAEDALTAVPTPMRDGAIALGTTDWQATTSVTVPSAISGVSAAILLGVGRALGETMAATVILANVTRLPDPLYDVFGNTITLTSLIASQYGVAAGRPMQLSALFAAGVVLFVTVLVLSVGSQLIERRMRRSLGGAE
ncbi:MAG: phosphate ABC transporter permease subunit PstC [Halanaeroarchaeum sp.]